MIGLCQEGKSSPDALWRSAGVSSFLVLRCVCWPLSRGSYSLGVSESASAEFSFCTPSAPPSTYAFKLMIAADTNVADCIHLDMIGPSVKTYSGEMPSSYAGIAKCGSAKRSSILECVFTALCDESRTFERNCLTSSSYLQCVLEPKEW